MFCSRLGPSILDALDQMKEQLPIGIETHLVAYQTTYVEKSVDNFVASLVQGVGIVLAVTLLALGLRTGLIVAAILPLTMIGSMALMEVFGISMNKMSLAALIIALGLLVDSAIVMAESIQVSIREGRTPVQAAIESASELRFPLLVSSLTTAAALLPTYLAESTTGEYTSAIFEVVTIALLLAWVLALTITPLLSVLSASTEEKADKKEDSGVYDSGFYRRYQALLLTLVRRRWISLAAFIALFAVSLWAFRFVPQLFFPRKEQTTFKIELELPESAPFERTAAAKILRRDRQRTLTVQADLDPSADRSVTPFSVAAAVVPMLEEASATWPLGYRYELGGEVESSGDAQASIQAKQPIAILAILSLLVLQFNSLRGPLIVLTTLPLTLIGVVGGLVLTQKPFGFMALLGVIALFGVVINNAVVLLDRIETEMKKYRRSRAAAVLEASKRPILLTTATTVGGLIPLWLTGGPMFSPMAVAFLFGLIASTVLTLGFVPVIYGILYRMDFKDVETELAGAHNP